ncbi:MAG: ATP-binding protein [Chloroflexia bacterium]
MITWLRDRGIFLLSIAFPLVSLGLILLAALGNWGPAGLIPLSLAALASAGAFTLALLRLAYVPSRNWGRELRRRQLEFEQARERVFELTQELRRKSDQLTAERDRAEFLRQSFAELADSLQPRHVLDGILSRAIRATGARWGSILLLDEDGNLSQSFFSRPAERSVNRRTARILDQGLAGWVVRHRQGCVVYDTAQDPRWLSFPEDREPSRSAVAVPFVRRERVLGVMVLTHHVPYQFGEGQLALLEELARQAAICLENADLYTTAENERKKLAAILEGTADAVIVLDTAGRVARLNRSAERAFGLSAEALGRPPEEVLPPALADLLARAMRDGEAVTGEITTADGRVRFCSLSPVAGVGWVAILQDITHLKELDRLKSEFVSTVSHDLRSPLTTVRGYADLVGMLGPLTEEQRGAVERIRRAVEQMNELITDLLDLGKIEAGIEMEMGPCSLNTVVLEAVETLSPRAAEKGLKLTAEIGRDVPVVRGNARRLRQVVVNLVENAIKYTPSGGSVQVRLERDEKEVICSVSDTGIGIDPQDQKGLFQKFYRVRSPQAEGIPGTGLGLAICRSIVEQHGGRIGVRSMPGRGSTFFFALPVPSEERSDPAIAG